MVISRTSPEWNELEFGVICDVQNGYAFKSENFISHGIPIIKIANIQDGKVVIDEASSYPEISISDNFFVNTGDILLAMSGATTGKVGVYTGKRRLYLNQRVCKMVCKDSSKTYYPYVKYLLSSNLFVKQLESSLTAGAQPNLSPKQVSKMIFKIPSYDEQKAIATALSDVDELIANLEKLIEKKKAIKQGTMQELLSGKKRLPGFKDAWQEVALKEIADMYAGGTPSSANRSYYGGGIPWVSITDITNTEKYLYKTANTLTESGFASCSAKMYPANTLLFAMYASIGKCSIAPVSVTSSQAILGIFNLRNCDLEYLYYVLASRNAEFLSMGQTGTQSNLSKNIIQQIKILLPTMEEQKMIASVLAGMDLEIENLGFKLKKYHHLKQAMMQKLLTGEIRLV